jgi:hypothetical protein
MIIFESHVTCVNAILCRMQKDRIPATWNIYYASDMIALSNESLELGTLCGEWS